MGYIVSNPDNTFKIFRFKPIRCSRPITKKATYKEIDAYGDLYYPDIPTGEYEEFWGYPYIPAHSLYLQYDEGIEINKNLLCYELQKLTFKDEPVEI